MVASAPRHRAIKAARATLRSDHSRPRVHIRMERWPCLRAAHPRRARPAALPTGAAAVAATTAVAAVTAPRGAGLVPLLAGLVAAAAIAAGRSSSGVPVPGRGRDGPRPPWPSRCSWPATPRAGGHRPGHVVGARLASAAGIAALTALSLLSEAMPRHQRIREGLEAVLIAGGVTIVIWVLRSATSQHRPHCRSPSAWSRSPPRAASRSSARPRRSCCCAHRAATAPASGATSAARCWSGSPRSSRARST